MTWLVEREKGGARVTFASDCDLPVRALAPHLSAFRILRFQRDEADAIVANLAGHFKHPPAPRRRWGWRGPV
jgi:hypothetical protein